MNKYNIKIGDYVETADGAIGFVAEVKKRCFFGDFYKRCKQF